jgi:hypothetical protein
MLDAHAKRKLLALFGPLPDRQWPALRHRRRHRLDSELGSERLGAAISPITTAYSNIVSDPAPVEFLDGAMAIGILSWVREDGVRAADARG